MKIEFKNSKWITYFCILLCICHCFSHLIGLHSVTLLSLFYKFNRFYLFFVSLWQRASARNVIPYYPYRQYTDLLYFDLYHYSAYAAHYVHCLYILGIHTLSFLSHSDDWRVFYWNISFLYQISQKLSKVRYENY